MFIYRGGEVGSATPCAAPTRDGFSCCVVQESFSSFFVQTHRQDATSLISVRDEILFF
jgi:hypothetical protein